MIIKKKVKYYQEYLPTKRHKRVLKRRISEFFDIEVAEVKEEDFPVAFKVKWGHYDCFISEKLLQPVHVSEVRLHAGNLYLPKIYHSRVDNTATPVPAERLGDWLNDLPWEKSVLSQDKFSEASIIVSDNRSKAIENMKEQASKFIIFNGEIWYLCKEPVYEVCTVDSCSGRDYTGISVTFKDTNHDNRYFNALQLEEALQYAKTSAKKYGGDLNVSAFEEKLVGIEVAMPEMVRVEKHKDLFPARLVINTTVEIQVPANNAEEAASIAAKEFTPKDFFDASILELHCKAVDAKPTETVSAGKEASSDVTESTREADPKDVLEAEYTELLESLKAEGSALAFYLAENLTELSDEVTEEEYTAEYDRIMRVFSNTWEQYRRSISKNRKNFRELCNEASDVK